MIPNLRPTSPSLLHGSRFLEWSSCYIPWRIHKIFLNESSLKVTYRTKAGTGCSNHYIQWISTREANYIINSIVINPVDSVIHLLNNWTCSSGSGPSDKGGASYPDPEITGRGGRSSKFFFRPQLVWSKNKEGPPPSPGPSPRSATVLYPPFPLTLIWEKPEDNLIDFFYRIWALICPIWL